MVGRSLGVYYKCCCCCCYTTKWADSCRPHFSEWWFGKIVRLDQRHNHSNERKTKKQNQSNQFHFVFITFAKITENLASFFSRLNSLKVPGVCVCVCIYFLTWNQSSMSGYESKANVFHEWDRPRDRKKDPSLRGGCARGSPTRHCTCNPTPLLPPLNCK